MKTINKYSVTELSNAIDDAVNVSFGQMIDTIRNQCYMSQTETSWEDCDELEFLEDIPFKFTDGKDMKVMIQNQMKRIVISTLTDSDWVGKNDAMYKPLIDMYTKKLQTEDISTGRYKKSDSHHHLDKFFQTNDSENSVIILALETLLEQVRDARDFEQIARVKTLLDSWKTLDDDKPRKAILEQQALNRKIAEKEDKRQK